MRSDNSILIGDQSKGSQSNAAVWGAFVVLGLGYGLLLAAPHVLEHLRTLRGGAASGAGWLPAAAAAGLALGGGAAMVFVLARLVRDVEHQPYACFAPVLAVFAGFVLAGLHAKLPLGSIPSQYVGVFGLVLSVVGGALVQQRAWSTRIAGLLVTMLAPAAIAAVLWSHSQKSTFGAMLVSLDSQVRVFLVLLTVCSASMVIVAIASRALLTYRENQLAQRVNPNTGVGWAHGANTDGFYSPGAGEAGSFGAPLYQSGPTAAPAFDLSAEAWGSYQDQVDVASRRSPWVWGAVITVLLASAAAAAYYLYVRPRQQAAAAAEANAAPQEVQAAAAQQSEEAKAAAERLRNLLDSQDNAAGHGAAGVAAAPGAPQADPEPAPEASAGAAAVADDANEVGSPADEVVEAEQPAAKAAGPAQKRRALAARRKRARRQRAAARRTRQAAVQQKVAALEESSSAKAAPLATPKAAKPKAKQRRLDTSSLAVQAAKRVGSQSSGSKTPEQTLLDELSAPDKADKKAAPNDDPIFGL